MSKENNNISCVTGCLALFITPFITVMGWIITTMQFYLIYNLVLDVKPEMLNTVYFLIGTYIFFQITSLVTLLILYGGQISEKVLNYINNR